ncbi:hypothetical protein [Dysgonomonas sp. 25]|uniref:hypothetical protein n=1 Tax=Dysgonomonas sp. 25 TaxID=2302933 RepID=UPI0013D29949|nr:hypothetical protein [Dysgonomonas sp. 25]
MKAADCVKLEDKTIFKKEYLKQTGWWKNYSFIPPSLLLFLGLAGLIYLTKAEMLVTFYSIPFVLVFLLGTIWMKAVKKHIRDAKFNHPETFRVCLAQPVTTINGYTCLVFTLGQKRHNAFFAKQLAEEISVDENTLSLYKNKVQKQHVQSVDADCYVIAYPTSIIHKKNPLWDENKEVLPLLYVDEKNVLVIKGKDLK